jgi:hypothetical protein
MSQSEVDPNDVLYSGRTSESSRGLGSEDLGRLEAAIEVAYSKARTRFGDQPVKLRVLGIYVEGTNPISDYTVVLGDVS